MTQIRWLPLTPLYMRHFQIFEKIDSFLKNVSDVLGSKKCRLHLLKNRLIYIKSYTQNTLTISLSATAVIQFLLQEFIQKAY